MKQTKRMKYFLPSLVKFVNLRPINYQDLWTLI